MWIKHKNTLLNASGLAKVSFEMDKKIILTNHSGQEEILTFKSKEDKDRALDKIKKDIIRGIIPIE